MQRSRSLLFANQQILAAPRRPSSAAVHLERENTKVAGAQLGGSRKATIILGRQTEGFNVVPSVPESAQPFRNAAVLPGARTRALFCFVFFSFPVSACPLLEVCAANGKRRVEEKREAATAAIFGLL